MGGNFLFAAHIFSSLSFCFILDSVVKRISGKNKRNIRSSALLRACRRRMRPVIDGNNTLGRNAEALHYFEHEHPEGKGIFRIKKRKSN